MSKFLVTLANEFSATISVPGAEDLIDLVVMLDEAESDWITVNVHVGENTARAILRADDICSISEIYQ